MIERKATRAPVGNWLSARQAAGQKLVGRAANRRPIRDFAVTLMLAAVVGVACQVLGLAVEVGRSAGWWP
jgi:hypothetical protein